MIFGSFTKNRYLTSVFGLAFAVLMLAFILAMFFLGPLKPPLVLHYDTYGGVIDFKGGVWDVLGILAAAFFMEIIDFFLAGFLYYRECFLSYVFTFFTLLLSILILIGVSVMISVN
ncbi:MAG: hypothetical protein NTW60_03715 [Candidatus Wolfebacteria bacterium]|nr:hypothetical protein [Candidatus Wolfebacteria bacterium]